MKRIELTTIFLLFSLTFIMVGFSACSDDKNYDMSSLNNDMDDEADFEEYISDAKRSANNERFSTAYSFLEKARELGVSSSELASAKSYVARKKSAYNERIEREREAKLQRQRAQRQAQRARENSASQARNTKQREDSFCYSLSSSSAREACLGNAFSTESSDARNIIQGNCYSLSNSALTQVCLQGKQGCFSFNNSDVMNACVQCGGSNRWLRTYAAGSLFNCY